jgi:hypothetical protein
MNRKSFLVGLLAAGCFVATSTLMTSPGNAQADPKVAKAMAILKAETAKLGAPKAEGTDQTADKTTPGLYFGSTKVNNDFTIVDKVRVFGNWPVTVAPFRMSNFEQNWLCLPRYSEPVTSC